MANLSNINNKFLVTTGGNVLIGQTSAVGSSIFQVTGASTLGSDVTMANGNVHIHQTGADYLTYIDFLRSSANVNPTARIHVTEPAATHTSRMEFYTSNASGSVPNLRRAMFLDQNLKAYFDGTIETVGNATFGGSTLLDGLASNGYRIYKIRLQAPFTGGWNTITPGTVIGGLQQTNFRTDGGANNIAAAVDFELENNTYGTGQTRISFKCGGVNGVNSTEKMRIDSSGNVGIGTDSLTGKLNVEASGNHLHLRASTAPAGKFWNFDITSNNQLFIVTDNNKGINIDNLGKVGIGTTTPFGKLSVTGASAVAGDAGIFQITDGTGANTDTKITMGVVASDYGWIQAVKPGTDNLDLALNVNGGNVGIATSTPQTTLQVNGAASALNAHFGQGQNNLSGVFGGISLGYAEIANASYRKVGIVAQAKGDNAARQDLHFLVDTSTDAQSAAITDSKMHITYDTGDVIINNKLGIGTTSPSTNFQVKNNFFEHAVGKGHTGPGNLFSIQFGTSAQANKGSIIVTIFGSRFSPGQNDFAGGAVYYLTRSNVGTISVVTASTTGTWQPIIDVNNTTKIWTFSSESPLGGSAGNFTSYSVTIQGIGHNGSTVINPTVTIL